MAIHYEAQNRAVAAGGQLAAEELAKREKHPPDAVVPAASRSCGSLSRMAIAPIGGGRGSNT
jgi:hypothetical protein